MPTDAPAAFTVNGLPIGWQPIGTAPDDGQCFLAVDSFGQQWICAKADGKLIGIGQKVCSIAACVAERATHWMPLPKSPQSIAR